MRTQSSLLEEDEKLIDDMEEIRRQNNILWMNILRFALRATPQKTRACMKLIKENDSKVATIIGRIGDHADS